MSNIRVVAVVRKKELVFGGPSNEETLDLALSLNYKGEIPQIGTYFCVNDYTPKDKYTRETFDHLGIKDDDLVFAKVTTVIQGQNCVSKEQYPVVICEYCSLHENKLLSRLNGL